MNRCWFKSVTSPALRGLILNSTVLAEEDKRSELEELHGVFTKYWSDDVCVFPCKANPDLSYLNVL